ncbi:MAG TPA: T9SS type A sorting domain-containing protein [Balneolales bacterium]|nr:T9SS type A sorting domain-containing protein [Balneolales bacterium]
MRTIFTLTIVVLLWPGGILKAQVRHIAWPVYIATQPAKPESASPIRQVAALQSDTLYFSSPDSLHTYSQSFGGSTTLGVFFTLPDSLFPVRITAFVVNFYGGNTQFGNELSPASIKAILWQNAKVPTDIQPGNQIRDTFNQTVSVNTTDQYLPFTFSFSDTTRIMNPDSFAVGLQYSGVSDTTSAVSPIFSTPPAAYNEFYIDSTITGTDTTANYYDHQTYWKSPDQVGGISGWLLLEHDPNWVQTAIEQPADKPSHASILRNYPNPFNPSTQLVFESGASGHAVLEIYDILGRSVYKQSYRVQAGQTYHWRWIASDFPSGIYIARVQLKDQVVIRKMALLK